MNSTPWTCPECGGHWIRNYVFDHDRAACSIGNAEDATQAADFERLHTQRELVRDMTDAERTLAEAIAGYPMIRPAQFHAPDQPAPVSEPIMTTVTVEAPGVHHRVVGSVDPDVLAATAEGDEL